MRGCLPARASRPHSSRLVSRGQAMASDGRCRVRACSGEPDGIRLHGGSQARPARAGGCPMSALAIARLDAAAIWRSRWLWFCLIAYALLAVVLVTASSRESIVLGFTGSSRVLLSFSHALVLVLPLIALTAT